MLIIGARGFAKQLIEALPADWLEGLHFYDDVHEAPEPVFGRFPVLQSEKAAQAHFQRDSRFALGIGNSHYRELLAEKFSKLGGELTTVIAPGAKVSQWAKAVGAGCTIMHGAVVEGDATLGRGCLVNLLASVTHDCVVGDFCEICPGARLSGNCVVGAGSMIGTNATLLPGIKVGRGAKIGAGSVVTKDIPDFATAAGIPARVIHRKTAAS